MVVLTQGLLDILRLYAILVKKWLLLVKCVYGAIFHYMLLITDWVVRQTEQHQLTGEYVKPERPAVDTGKWLFQLVVTFMGPVDQTICNLNQNEIKGSTF